MRSSPPRKAGPFTGSHPPRPSELEEDDAPDRTACLRLERTGSRPLGKNPTRPRMLTRPHRGVTSMTFHRRSLLKLAGATAASAGLGIGAPAIVRAATPVKMTSPWLPLGTFSYAFVANKMGFWDKRGLEVTIDRGFGSGRV